MNRKPAVWLASAVGMVALGSTLLAVSGIANAVEVPTLQSTPAQLSQPHVLVAQAATEATAVRASYSSEQADRGETTYKKECVECHGDDLRGGLLGGPPLRGVAFEEKYAKGSPAGVLFEVMSGTMPPNDPGRYSAATYTDIMAYLLKRNGFPASAPLPDNVDALYELVIEK